MERFDLPGLEDFIAVSSRGGLNAASRETGVPKATLSRRIRDLEAALGTRLLERSQHRLRLTEEGQMLLERAAPLMSELRAVGEAVSGRGQEPSGLLKISVSSLFAQTRMGAFGAAFTRQYPQVTLCVDVSDSFVDPVRDGYDLVVRGNPPADTDLVGACFLRSETVLAAAPAIHRPDESEAEVPAVVLAAQAELDVWAIFDGGQEQRLRPRPVMVCSAMTVVHQAALAGAGCALLPDWLIEDDLAQGRLVQWGVVPNRLVEAWVLHTSRRLTSPKVRAFVDALVAAHRS
ncbi:MAG: LysR family transcriptional regulator [Alphaproteobacteria bacterium]|nr:LysR family transcriptional regulator [Alphaproteobacteria bacterium]